MRAFASDHAESEQKGNSLGEKGNWCIYALDGTEERVDNLCMWRCLTVHYRGDRKQHEKRTTRGTLNLAREYYESISKTVY